MAKVKCEPGFTQLTKLNIQDARKLTVEGAEVEVINPDHFTTPVQASFDSVNSFSMSGNHTEAFQIGRRVQLDSGQSDINCNVSPEDLTPADIFTVNKYDYSIITAIQFDGVTTDVTITDSILTTDLEEASVDINWSSSQVGLITTTELINSTQGYPSDYVLETSGFTTSGDGGGAKWNQNGVIAQAPSQQPIDYNDGLITDAQGNQWALVHNGVIDPYQLGYINDNTDIDTERAQCSVNALKAKGGTVLFPAGTHKLRAIYDPLRNWTPPGYNDDNEMRRANKALIIYESDNIKIKGSGAIIDRSGDAIPDVNYAQYSSTIYTSKSTDIEISNLTIIGTQNDDDLLNDLKSNTSGNSITINSGSKDILIENVILQDGTNGIAVGINRTSGSQSIDPALEDCENIKLSNITVRNNEHGILLAACNVVELSNVDVSRFTRSDLSVGVIQRGVYIHSARNVYASNINISGVYKVGINISDYRDVYNIHFNNTNIINGMPESEKISRVGSSYNATFESIGIRVAGTQDNNTSKVFFDKFIINGCYSGARINSGNNDNINLSNGHINSHAIGIDNLDYTTSGSSTSQFNYNFANISIVVDTDLANFPTTSVISGLNLNTDGPTNANGLSLNNINIKSENRCGRVTAFNGNVVDSYFEYTPGLAGSRAFDLNIKDGLNWLSGNTFATEGRPNKGQDTPADIDTIGVQLFSTDFSMKIDDSVTPLLKSEMSFELTNDATLTIKVKGNDGTVRSNTLTLT